MTTPYSPLSGAAQDESLREYFLPLPGNGSDDDTSGGGGFPLPQPDPEPAPPPPPPPPPEPLPVATLDQLSDYLTTGYWADSGRSGRQFAENPGNNAQYVISVNLSELPHEARVLARLALDTWELMADIHFEEVSIFGDIRMDDDDADAYAYNLTSQANGGGGEIYTSGVNISPEWLDTYGTSLDGYGFQTYIHELGHALGLGHPGDYNGNAGAQIYYNDSWQLSVMSYFAQGERDTDDDGLPDVNATYAWVTTPMQADVQAIQSLYGLSSKSEGDTTWGTGGTLSHHFSTLFAGIDDDDPDTEEAEAIAFTLYDRATDIPLGYDGGIDTIDLSPSSSDDFLDLTAGTFSDLGGHVGNVGIAAGSEFENALMGSGHDTVVGNGLDNDLRGNGGKDRLYGFSGEDTIKGGAGRDHLWGDGDEDRLFGGGGKDHLFGGTKNDKLWGGSGNDYLNSGEGNDTMTGGVGADTFFYGFGHDRDRIRDFVLGEDKLQFAAIEFDGMDAQDIVDTYARDTSNGIRFDFGTSGVLGSSFNDQLLLKDVHDLAALVDDIVLI